MDALPPPSVERAERQAALTFSQESAIRREGRGLRGGGCSRRARASRRRPTRASYPEGGRRPAAVGATTSRDVTLTRLPAEPWQARPRRGAKLHPWPRKSEAIDPREPADLLLRHLRTTRSGLSVREAERRLLTEGPNELTRHTGATWPRELVRQLTHPLALLLWVAAVLAYFAGTPALALAIVGVILLNAAFAFVQERQAERAVEALGRYLPSQATVVRDGRRSEIEATRLVPGDLLLIEEGDRSRPMRACSTARSRSTCRRSPANRSRFCARPSTRMSSWSAARGPGSRVQRDAPARAARREASSSQRECARSSDGSRRCRSAFSAKRARWRRRSNGSPG